MADYESLHRQCRTLESLFDTKLTSYSRLASTITRNQDDVEAGGSRERWKDVEGEVEDLLEKLRETNDELLALSNNPDTPPSQSMSRAIQRHGEVYQDYAKELRRTKVCPVSMLCEPSSHYTLQTNVQHALDKVNLLSGVRNDIEAYKSSAADSLLAERGRIDSSHSMTDQILE
ncbi:hypothetical protein F4604DRAFT_1726883 [Suillus subluteus]|nr:hypothetical protein F4604DRAFT_1726883 [Suillus subluteus]